MSLLIKEFSLFFWQVRSTASRRIKADYCTTARLYHTILYYDNHQHHQHFLLLDSRYKTKPKMNLLLINILTIILLATPSFGHLRRLARCGNGRINSGEQCGEPGLTPCADGTQSCVDCVCQSSATTTTTATTTVGSLTGTCSNDATYFCNSSVNCPKICSRGDVVACQRDNDCNRGGKCNLEDGTTCIGSTTTTVPVSTSTIH